MTRDLLHGEQIRPAAPMLRARSPRSPATRVLPQGRGRCHPFLWDVSTGSPLARLKSLFAWTWVRQLTVPTRHRANLLPLRSTCGHLQGPSQGGARKATAWVRFSETTSLTKAAFPGFLFLMMIACQMHCKSRYKLSITSFRKPRRVRDVQNATMTSWSATWLLSWASRTMQTRVRMHGHL